jgi:uncharacterized membrane protein required for colicin V production
MLDLIIIILFISGIIIGLRRGFILQFIHLTGFIIAFIVAKMYMNDLADKLILWVPYPSFSGDTPINMILNSGNLEDAYYRGIAFVFIFFAVKIVMQIIGSMLDFIAHLPILKQFNAMAGAVLGFIEVYLIAFIILYFIALVPIGTIQNSLHNSVLAESIVKHTPILSQDIKELWMNEKP